MLVKIRDYPGSGKMMRHVACSFPGMVRQDATGGFQSEQKNVKFNLGVIIIKLII
jgi:hypothetical protein